MLVREDVGMRVQCGEVRLPRGQGKLDARDVSLAGEAGTGVVTSRNISNVLRCTYRCICFMDDDGARGAIRDAVLRYSSVAVRWNHYGM